MEPKSIKKPSKNEVQKIMQKGCQKGVCPLGAPSPLEGSLLRREQTNRKTTNYCRKLEVLCKCRVHKESEQSKNPIPTRLGRLRPGADFRGPWPPGGGPKYAHASKERRDLNTPVARGLRIFDKLVKADETLILFGYKFSFPSKMNENSMFSALNAAPGCA